ncbi:hypothetical protein [Paenibacillus sp. FSL H8-0034]|uniref:hypothetical protein n=1 Tax=Paenibacillus sp. FSL H8-0034 TaxID=2954671 RepID=UPI0030F954E5
MTMTIKQLNFLSEEVQAYLTEMVRQGKTTASFQFVLQQIEAYNDFEDETPEEIQQIKAFALDGFKRQLAQAISRNNNHCGQSVAVSTVYAQAINGHSLEISCSVCGSLKIIKAAPATTNSENGQALQSMQS